MINSEIRRDYIQEKYVIIAPRRGSRPQAVTFAQESRPAPAPRGPCVFCPEKVDRQKYLLQTGNHGGWSVKVISNKYPAVTLDNPQAHGTQEIVIETPRHTVELEDLKVEEISEVLGVYAARTKAITDLPKIEYVLIFKNQGGRAGATLGHAHSQIFATQFLPPHLFDKSQRIQAYKLRTGRCVYCDVIAKERKSPRVVYDDGVTAAFTPYASMYNYEVWVLPRRHLDNIGDLTESERISWAKNMKRLLHKISKLGLPYNYYFHQVVHDEDQHLYMKITPRGSVWAGVEIGSGLIINPVSPEEAARYYRA